jgi:uncharacterized membrane protein
MNNNTNAPQDAASDDALKTGKATSAHSTQALQHARQDLAHKLFATSIPGTEIKKQISYIAPGQTAKALMLIYLTFSVPIVLLAIIVAFFRYGQIPIATVFSVLIGNVIMGFILLWIACQAYNWVASRFGGIEIVLSDIPEEL